MKKHVLSITLVSLCMAVSMAFSIEPSEKSEQEDRIETALQKKIAILRMEKRADCKRVAVEKAEMYIDSIIAYEVTQRQLQLKGVPPRPNRPEWDSLNQKPLDIDLIPLLKDGR